jgi:GNAT superfamily N-acetyltransferase
VTGFYTSHDDPRHDERWLGWFGTLPCHQRTGFGRAMLDKTIEHMHKDAGKLVAVKLLTSCFDRDKDCHGFYERCGFEIYEQKETVPYPTYYLRKEVAQLAYADA